MTRDLEAENARGVAALAALTTYRRALAALSPPSASEARHSPHVSFSADGEVGLSWSRGTDRFEAMIGSEGIEWCQKLDGEFIDHVDAPGPSGFVLALRKFLGVEHPQLSPTSASEQSEDAS